MERRRSSSKKYPSIVYGQIDFMNKTFSGRLGSSSSRGSDSRDLNIANSTDLRDILKSKQGKRSNDSSSLHYPISKKRRNSFSTNDVVPMHKNYQLLGDSQFVRFSEQILSMRNLVNMTADTNSRRIGYCVSGQKINDLQDRLTHREFHIHSNVILLIGTNDLLYNTTYLDMCTQYDEILEILMAVCENIVLLTVPPVPRLTNASHHWSTLKRFNNFLKEKADGDKVFVIDFGSLFIGFDNTIDLDYFEKSFFDKRSDLIHLNEKGFKLLKSVLDIQYFDNKD